jgi:methyl-accepting chemotaxis protein
MPNLGKVKLSYQILLLAGIAVLVFFGVWQWHKNAIKVAESDFIELQQVTIIDTKQRQLEDTFNTLYRNLRTISLLPSVRNITGSNRSGDGEDVVASGRFTPEGQQTVQQIYNNLIGSVSVSEVYAVIDGLDPSKGQIPFFMYDALVFGTPKAEDSAAKDPDFPEEDETAEYAYFPIQTAAIKAVHDQFNFTDLDQIPAFASPLMRTCDNTQYPSKSRGDESETHGILYSVPFYNAQSQQFTGVISGIVRGNVFEAALLGVPFIPITDEDKAEQKKSDWQMPSPARFMLANEKYGIRIKDRRATELAQQLAQGDAGRNSFHVPLKVHGDSEWVLSYYLPESTIRAAGANIEQIFNILCFVDLGLLLCSVAVIVLMRRTKEKAVREVGNVFKALAQGHLTRRMHGELDASMESLKHDSNRTIDKLNAMLWQIKASGETIDASAQNIAQGSSELSRGIMEESSNLEEAVSTMGGLAQTVQGSADHARQASQRAQSASEVARQGGAAVGQVTATMTEINTASKRIFDIISVIDGIAFQTNILALNAAVEAARAGEQGRGFAVVATEVRALAQRSANAAKEIKGLIANSEEKVAAGTALANQASHTMNEVVSSIQQVTDLIGEIAATILAQSNNIQQVNDFLISVTERTHQNTALVERAAAEATSLQDQSDSLKEAIASFTLEDQSR